jgi:hypothetical protein
LIAYSVAIPLGLLYTRILKREKIDALRLNKWNFDAKMMLSNECFEDINYCSRIVTQNLYMFVAKIT